MKGCVQCNFVTVEKILTQAGIKPRSARSVGQCLTHSATRAPQKKLGGGGLVTLKNSNTEMPISCFFDKGTLFEYNVFLML